MPKYLSQYRNEYQPPSLEEFYKLTGLGGSGVAPGGEGMITAGEIWDPQQVNQKVNLMRAMADQGTQHQIAGIERDMASRGFGQNSPLLAALKAGTQATGRASNAANENQLRWNAAMGNASHLLQSQSAAAKDDLERRRFAFDMWRDRANYQNNLNQTAAQMHTALTQGSMQGNEAVSQRQAPQVRAGLNHGYVSGGRGAGSVGGAVANNAGAMRAPGISGYQFARGSRM